VRLFSLMDFDLRSWGLCLSDCVSSVVRHGSLAPSYFVALFFRYCIRNL